MSLKLRDEVLNAILDYKYLLNRGYNQKTSLDLVTSRYMLSRTERMLLFRCVHSDVDASEICRKLLTPSEVSNYKMVIDGFNTLLTVTSVLEGDDVYLCDDCFVRDLRSTKFKDFGLEIIKESAQKLINYINILKPIDSIIILDKQVSKSGELKKILTELLGHINIVLASKADIAVLSEGGVIASSDFVILKKASRIFDIAGYIISKEFKDKILDLREVIKKHNNFKIHYK